MSKKYQRLEQFHYEVSETADRIAQIIRKLISESLIRMGEAV